MKHAAYSNTKKILFVNRGVDITRPLSAQNDCFWWGFQNFSKLKEQYKSFLRIVRGYESEHLNQPENSNNNVENSDKENIYVEPTPLPLDLTDEEENKDINFYENSNYETVTYDKYDNYDIVNYIEAEGYITTESIGGKNTKLLPQGAFINEINPSKGYISISYLDEIFVISFEG